MTDMVLGEKPYAGNPHKWIDEGGCASCTAEALLRRGPSRRLPEGRASGCARPRRQAPLRTSVAKSVAWLSIAAAAICASSHVAYAGNVVEVVSSDGLTTTGYETMDDGFAAANQDGMTIRLLEDIDWNVSWKEIGHSLKWDLNGHTLKNKQNDFLCVGDSQTQWFYGGGTLRGAGSILAGSGGGGEGLTPMVE